MFNVSYPVGRQGNLRVHQSKNKEGEPNGFWHFWFLCPGCEEHHMFEVPPWNFNGDFNKPTFHPSITVTGAKGLCHVFLRDGKLSYLADTDHALVGKVVPLPELPHDKETIA